MSIKRKEVKGYLYIFVGASLWGVSSVVAKSLFNTGLPPAQLVLVRLTLSTLVLLAILLFSDRKQLIIAGRDLPYFLVFGFVGVAGVQYTYYFTISKINVGPGVLIQYLAPIWITLYAFFFQKEPATRWKIFSLLLAILGCYLVMGGYQIDLFSLNRIGMVSGVVSSLFFAFYSLYGEKGLKRYGPWTIILYGFGFGALFYWIVASPLNVLTANYSLNIWLAFLFIAIFSTLIPFGFYFKGIERVRATRASIASTWEPVVAGLTAYLALGEVLDPLQVAGGIAVIVAVILLQIGKEKAAPSSSIEIRHQEPADSP
jgi:drug/metabolite transporter (DMT)-like permease